MSSTWSAPIGHASLASAWALKRRQLQWSDRPILVGPFVGEVGFEVLYWLPFLAKLRKELGIDPARMMAVTRGGAGAWYQVPKGIELYQVRPPKVLRQQQRLAFMQKKSMKQTAWTAFERGMIADIRKAVGQQDALLLHPSWMYRLLDPFWQARRGINWLNQFLLFEQFGPMPLPAGVTLPEKYVAVKFYARPTFPIESVSVDFAKASITQLAAQVPVILLNQNGHFDDHLDLMPAKTLPANVYRMTDLFPVTPENGLTVQSMVLSRAMGFVGTYGGTAQLALRFGRPVLSVYHEFKDTAWAHRHLSELLATHYGVPFVVQRMGDLPALQQAMPQMLLDQTSISSGGNPSLRVR